MTLNLCDYIIISILILSSIAGFRQGFINAMGHIIGLAAGVLLAILYYDNIALYMEEYYGLTTYLSEVIRNKIPLTVLNMDVNFLTNGLNFADAAHYLAYLLIIAVSFILIFLVSSKVVQLLWSSMNTLFSWGILSSINRILGMVLGLGRSVIILTILLGLIFPALQLASGIGFYGALPVVDNLEHSLFTAYMLGAYDYMKGIIGIQIGMI